MINLPDNLNNDPVVDSLEEEDFPEEEQIDFLKKLVETLGMDSFTKKDVEDIIGDTSPLNILVKKGWVEFDPDEQTYSIDPNNPLLNEI